MRVWRRMACVCIGVAALLAGGPVYAASCYSSSEAEAEQAIRIHTELMIIGLNCQHRTPKGQVNLYQQYNQFTQKNGTVLADYERMLVGYFSRSGVNAENQINALRTRFANRISLEAARMRPDLFCQHYGSRISQAATMTKGQLRQWAATPFASHPPSRPLCASDVIRR